MFTKRFLIRSSRVVVPGTSFKGGDDPSTAVVVVVDVFIIEPLTFLSNGLTRSPADPPKLLPLILPLVKGFRVNKEETYEDVVVATTEDDEVKPPSITNPLLPIPDTLLLREDVAVEGRDGMGGGAC